jgi:hypothetical protein
MITSVGSLNFHQLGVGRRKLRDLTQNRSLVPASAATHSNLFSLSCSRRVCPFARSPRAHVRFCCCPAAAMRSTTRPGHPPPRPSRCPAAIDDCPGRRTGLHLWSTSACTPLPDRCPSQLLRCPGPLPPQSEPSTMLPSQASSSLTPDSQHRQGVVVGRPPLFNFPSNF